MLGSSLYEECKADSSVTSQLQSFWKTFARENISALLMDFDGTLAPFRVDPLKVQLWSGVHGILQQIQDTGKTRMAIITGRPALEVASLFALRQPIEIWGAHGAERLDIGGKLEKESLSVETHSALIAAKHALHSVHFKGRVRIEEKWDAVAMHCRGVPTHLAREAIERTLDVLYPFSDIAGLQILRFDGGIELRAGRKKGDAVRQILDELEQEAPVAYLGDDETDEDAFQSLAGRGLSILVQRQWRTSIADIWIAPPAGLRSFLTGWLVAVTPECN